MTVAAVAMTQAATSGLLTLIMERCCDAVAVVVVAITTTVAMKPTAMVASTLAIAIEQ